MFGLRLLRGSFAYFIQQLARVAPLPLTDKGRVEATFGPTVFIHLTRADKLDQAISFVKASQTGLWHKAPDGTEIERTAAPQTPRYDRHQITAKLAEFQAFDTAWDNWFNREGIQPLRITYDALAAAPKQVMADILTRLGLDAALAQTTRTPTAKLADTLNRDWAARYLRDTA